jgi:hypothetical protein
MDRPGSPPYSPNFFADKIIKPAEDAGEKVVKITMSVIDYADIRKFGRDVLDIITDPTIMKTGHMADMFCTQLHVKKELTLDILKLKPKKIIKLS